MFACGCCLMKVRIGLVAVSRLPEFRMTAGGVYTWHVASLGPDLGNLPVMPTALEFAGRPAVRADGGWLGGGSGALVTPRRHRFDCAPSARRALCTRLGGTRPGLTGPRMRISTVSAASRPAWLAKSAASPISSRIILACQLFRTAVRPDRPAARSYAYWQVTRAGQMSDMPVGRRSRRWPARRPQSPMRQRW